MSEFPKDPDMGELEHLRDDYVTWCSFISFVNLGGGWGGRVKDAAPWVRGREKKRRATSSRKKNGGVAMPACTPPTGHENQG